MDISISDNKEENRFETTIDGKTGFVDYKRKGDLMHLTHTEVPKALEGNGVGSALVKYALQASKNEGKKVVSHCSFVSGYIERHPELESYLA
tara:strand:+ start:38202 stop:38477 length:276 start_codon:yes stop_codon:yes gene_type:complete